jgi:hypothetical protein
MMKFQSKFDLLFEEIMNSTVNVNTFDFKFTKTKGGKIICNFEIYNAETNELVPLTAEIFEDGSRKFTYEKTGKELPEKTFMMNYYRDYENFFEALDNFQNSKKKAKDVTGDNSTGIISFKEKLNDIEVRNTGIKVIKDKITFKFYPLKDGKYDLVQANFNLINNKPEEDELNEYKAQAIIKLNPVNSIIVKIVCEPQDKNSDAENKEFVLSEFKERFGNYYIALTEAITEFERIQFN